MWAQKLKTARRMTGLTQMEAGEKIGRPQQTVAAWENGRSEPDISTLSQLFQLYGISANSFFGYQDATIAENQVIEMYRHVPPMAQHMVVVSLEETLRQSNIIFPGTLSQTVHRTKSAPHSYPSFSDTLTNLDSAAHDQTAELAGFFHDADQLLAHSHTKKR